MMTETIQTIISLILGLSFFGFGLLSLGILLFYQRRYIVRRFELETKLSELKCCRGIAAAFRGMNVVLALSYSMALFTALALNDKILHWLPGYRDIRTKQDILKHFSKAELRATCIYGISCLAAGISMLVGEILGK